MFIFKFMVDFYELENVMKYFFIKKIMDFECCVGNIIVGKK